MNTQLTAKLRVCASCEWVFEGHIPCPQCGFASYGAKHVYGNKAYKYKYTQEPFITQKLQTYKMTLMNQYGIYESIQLSKKLKPTIQLSFLPKFL
jgi:hypothetical protein